jgi:hypothetical protein
VGPEVWDKIKANLGAAVEKGDLKGNFEVGGGLKVGCLGEGGV